MDRKNHKIDYKNTEIVKYEKDKFKRVLIESGIMTYKYKNHLSKPSFQIYPIFF